MMRIATLLVALALACCASARADVLVPGTVRAHHVLRFVNVAEHAGHVFFVAAPETPIVLDVSPGGEVELASLNSIQLPEGIYLYAVPKSTPVPADLTGK